mgnify:CR=1 FL=1
MASPTLRELTGMNPNPSSISESALVLIDCQQTYREGIMQLVGVEPALKEAASLLKRFRAAGRPVRTRPVYEMQKEMGGVFGLNFGWEHPLWFAAEGEPRENQNDRDLDQPDQHIRHDLARHHLERIRRRRKEIFHRAALCLPRNREARHHHHRHRQDHAHQARHDVVLREALGVVAALDHQLERRGVRL